MNSPKVKIEFPKVQEYIKTLGLLPKGKVQKLIDSEIVLGSDPYVPSDTTYTRKSVFELTEFGSGKIKYSAYGNAPGRNIWNDTASKFQDAPKRGPFWVLRFWDAGGKEKIMLTVKRFLDGK
jgi:hypothetical protein